MAALRYRRQAATPKGFLRRLEDMKLDAIHDPRQLSKVLFSLRSVLSALILGAATGAHSMRAVEGRTEQAKDPVRQAIGLHERIADNTLSTLLPRLDPLQLRLALHLMVKAELRRENQAPVDLPFHVIAFDGKYLTTVTYRTMRKLAMKHYRKHCHDKNLDLDDFVTVERVESYIRTWQPDVQWCTSQDGLHWWGLVRVHRATLVSSAAALCVDQMTIPGDTNEIGAILMSLRQWYEAYRWTQFKDAVVTLDAGNTSAEVGAWLDDKQLGYFLALKSTHGNIHSHAVEVLNVDQRSPDLRLEMTEKGNDITYKAWQMPLLCGHGSWPSARQVVCIERLVVGDDPESASVGRRYFISNERMTELPVNEALKLCRLHWRCENEGHWTSDVMFGEDRRRAVGTTDPRGMVVLSLVRQLAQNLLALLRSLSRYDVAEGKPSWRMVMEHGLAALFDPVIDAERFELCDS